MKIIKSINQQRTIKLCYHSYHKKVMPAIVIIPSRYASTRFPGKPLCPLLGKPMIQHVYERVREAKLVKDAFVATDDRRIRDAVEGFGGKVLMTSEEHQSGTDRIAEAVVKLADAGYGIQEGDTVVNVQGDEPMIMPEMVDGVIRLMEDKKASIGTLARRIEDAAEIANPDVVKVVFNAEGFALYFSRAPIPYHRDSNKLPATNNELKGNNSENSLLNKVTRDYFKHIGIYAYRKEVLLKFSQLPPTKLERTEKLEQLRALENGFAIKVSKTVFDTIGVDTPLDLERVEKCLSLSS